MEGGTKLALVATWSMCILGCRVHRAKQHGLRQGAYTMILVYHDIQDDTELIRSIRRCQ